MGFGANSESSTRMQEDCSTVAQSGFYCQHLHFAFINAASRMCLSLSTLRSLR
jgi:hypothetical protein